MKLTIAIALALLMVPVARNDVDYHGYWDYPASDFNGEIFTGQQPASAEAFRRRFGATK